MPTQNTALDTTDKQLAATKANLPAKEINRHLELLLKQYQSLTVAFAENRQLLDDKIRGLDEQSRTTSTELHQINAELIQQNRNLNEFKHESLINRRNFGDTLEAQKSLNTKQVDELRAQIGSLMHNLETELNATQSVLNSQQDIIEDQTDRLLHLDAITEMLDASTTGNRKRINDLREETNQQKLLVKTQIDALYALHREHQRELDASKQLINALHLETERLDTSIANIANDLNIHKHQTHRRFTYTTSAIGIGAALSLAGFLGVKYLPLLQPTASKVQLAAIEQNLDNISETTVPQFEQRISTNAATINRLSLGHLSLRDTTDDISTDINQLNALFTDLSYEFRGPGIISAKGFVPQLPILSPSWLAEQPDQHYVVQLLGVYRYDDLVTFVNQNLSTLSQQNLVHTTTARGQREWHNLFYGSFATLDTALAAIEAMPLSLKVNKPWVRSIKDVNASIV